MMSWLTLNFQNPNSINSWEMINLHNMYLLLFTFIMTLIIFTLTLITLNMMNNKIMIENQSLENFWTIIPLIIIVIMMNWSIKCMYMNNEMKLSSLNVKIMGNQWFWTYEYMNLNKSIESYMINKNNFDFNLIETDNHLILPFNLQIMMITSSADVIHSWTLPSMNTKMDCIPNQLNQMTFKMMKPGIIFGQCSEVCGINHSFMPIQVESINMINFIKWINK